jgi:hypothetical protein
MKYTAHCKTLAIVVDDAARVISLRHAVCGYELLSALSMPVGLWQMGLIRPVTYRDPLPPVSIPDLTFGKHEWWINRDEYRADLELDSQTAPAPAIRSAADSLEFAWDLLLPDGSVRVEINLLGGDRERLEFRGAVELPAGWALKRFTFPRIRGFGDPAAPEADALLFPETWGVLRSNPLEDMTRYSGQYPAHINWCQMAAWLHGENGLYVGILDPDTHHTGIEMQYVEGAEDAPLETDRRCWHAAGGAPAPRPFQPLTERLARGVKPAMQWRCHHWPEMTAQWTCPYPVVLQGFSGTWFAAAAIHRQWAHRQRWCRRGPLSQRRDAPATLAGLDLWFCRYGFPPWSLEPQPAWDMQRAAHALHDFFQMPFGLHWYHWHHFNWHRNFPGHAPAVEGFAEAVRELQQRGIVIMPYCQGRLLYRDRAGFEAERAHASVEANGQPYLEKYTPQDDWPLALCPGDAWSRAQWQEAARLLWRQYGVEGVYFDQISAMPPSLCYHAGHGHPLGGGNQYWRGYDRALASMAALRDEDPRRFLASELMADAYLDRFDAFLSFVPALEDYVPLYTALYGGYAVALGRHTPADALKDLQLFAICQGEQLLFGGQLGWLNEDILRYPAAAVWLRDAARLRARIRPFLHYGNLEEPLEVAQARMLELTLAPALTGKERPVRLQRPAVRHTVWRGPDGRRLVLWLNESAEAAEARFALRAAWPRGGWTQWRLGNEASEAIGSGPEICLHIPALSMVALVSPAEAPTARKDML